MKQVEETDFRTALELVLHRAAATLDETGDEFPLYAASGDSGDAIWVTTHDGNWCAGYWIGLLWLAAKYADSAEARRRFVDAAYERIGVMESQPSAHLFAGLNHYYAGFLGFDIVGDSELQRLGLRGADAMLELFHVAARQVPIGDYATAPACSGVVRDRMPFDRRCIAAVDAVHTSLPVLWRAFAETGRPEYRATAVAHVRRHVEWHVRKNGATTQMTAFDPETGSPQQTFNPLAERSSGCWSRGLAWSVAGLAQAFASSGDESALCGIQRSVAYYTQKTPADLVPPWDLETADVDAKRDSSAAAVLAYGLLLLHSRVRAERNDAQTHDLERLGLNILSSLANRYQVRDSAASNAGAVLHGCYRGPEGLAVDNELIWGDFYFAAALDMLLDYRTAR